MERNIHVLLLIICGNIFWKTCLALDNGLALTPPMGWMAWQRYRCVIDCDRFPNECISEKLFKDVADLMVSEGYKDAGYEYLIIDDCWLEKNRTADGKLQPDRKRFPSGMKSLADYVHSKGLKFGLYEDYGNKTCEGYPGILGHMEEDAKTLAEWEIDYLKLDGCYSSVFDMEQGYPEFGRILNKTGRPIVYSCSWPAYQEYSGMKINYESMAKHCNLWRNYDDIQDSYASVTNIMDYFAMKQDFWQPYAGPGHWNDPDMLLIGNFGLSYEQSKAQMAVWAILAAPLLISADLRNMKPELKAILQNKDIIAVNQDPLGIQGRRVYREKSIDIWVKPITPVIKGYHSHAVAFVSRRSDGTPYSYNITLENIGLLNPDGYKFKDLFTPTQQESSTFVLKPKSYINVRINPSGAAFYKAISLAKEEL
ncbi:alpha-N-acetylgalactosaminidase-like [Planococcus citri]|uniref:alpha-N-acetylgalactosaminidase-like n=1 Tax=Planococcus citri TaxID=170843 RepID=UPI0031F7A75E